MEFTFAPLAGDDMALIHGQESAKRALEIAAIGGHAIDLIGDAELVQRFAAALPGIGGDASQIQPGATMRVELHQVEEHHRLLPPGEPSARILARVQRGRAALPAVDGIEPAAERLLADAGKHNCFTPVTLEAARVIARSVAANDGIRMVNRISIAEGLVYVILPREAEPRAPVPASAPILKPVQLSLF